jgi:hypothetical protein
VLPSSHRLLTCLAESAQVHTRPPGHHGHAATSVLSVNGSDTAKEIVLFGDVTSDRALCSLYPLCYFTLFPKVHGPMQCTAEYVPQLFVNLNLCTTVAHFSLFICVLPPTL